MVNRKNRVSTCETCGDKKRRCKHTATPKTPPARTIYTLPGTPSPHKLPPPVPIVIPSLKKRNGERPDLQPSLWKGGYAIEKVVSIRHTHVFNSPTSSSGDGRNEKKRTRFADSEMDHYRKEDFSRETISVRLPAWMIEKEKSPSPTKQRTASNSCRMGKLGAGEEQNLNKLSEGARKELGRVTTTSKVINGKARSENERSDVFNDREGPEKIYKQLEEHPRVVNQFQYIPDQHNNPGEVNCVQRYNTLNGQEGRSVKVSLGPIAYFREPGVRNDQGTSFSNTSNTGAYDVDLEEQYLSSGSESVTSSDWDSIPFSRKTIPRGSTQLQVILEDPEDHDRNCETENLPLDYDGELGQQGTNSETQSENTRPMTTVAICEDGPCVETEPIYDKLVRNKYNHITAGINRPTPEQSTVPKMAESRIAPPVMESASHLRYVEPRTLLPPLLPGPIRLVIVPESPSRWTDPTETANRRFSGPLIFTPLNKPLSPIGLGEFPQAGWPQRKETWKTSNQNLNQNKRPAE